MIAQVYRHYPSAIEGLVIVAPKTVAHKLARACYHMLREQVPFDMSRAFG